MNTLDKAIQLALEEDLAPQGDLTSELLIPKDTQATLTVSARSQSGVFSGLDYAKRVFSALTPQPPLLKREGALMDGEQFQAGQELVTLTGSLRQLLIGERLFLNLLQRSISVASYTKQFSELIKHTKARITDTRKTAPGLRLLDKQAVLDGGGVNHRYNLSTAIMIKDNHIAGYNNIQEAVQYAITNKSPLTPLIVEVDTLEQLENICKLPDSQQITRILLDNMTPADIKEHALKLIPDSIQIEASGGININNVVDYAEAGVNYISLGCLTLNPPIIDIGLDCNT